MRERPVGAEFVKDLRERCLRHGNLAKMIQEWDLFFFFFLGLVIYPSPCIL